jgi:tetratricopeptide (TPR) repeat protein
MQTARRVVVMLPESAEAHADLGAILLRAELYPEAIVEFDEAIRLAPEQWQNQFDLGLAQTQLANWTKAEHAFAAADRVFPESSQIQRGWADLELARGDASAASTRLQKQIAARLLSATGRNSNINDANADAELNRHWITALSAAGQHDLAIETARQRTQFDNASSADWLALGQSLNAAGRFAQAIPALDASILLQAHHAETRYQLGFSHLHLGDVVESRRQMRLALEENPKHAQAWFQQANLAYAQGDLTTAAHDYRQSLASNPRGAAAHGNLGAVLFAQQNLPAAAVAFRRSLELSPNNAQAHYNLGLLLLQQDDLTGARLEILRAAELGQPCSAEVAEKLGLGR